MRLSHWIFVFIVSQSSLLLGAVLTEDAKITNDAVYSEDGYPIYVPANPQSDSSDSVDIAPVGSADFPKESGVWKLSTADEMFSIMFEIHDFHALKMNGDSRIVAVAFRNFDTNEAMVIPATYSRYSLSFRWVRKGKVYDASLTLQENDRFEGRVVGILENSEYVSDAVLQFVEPLSNAFLVENAELGVSMTEINDMIAAPMGLQRGYYIKHRSTGAYFYYIQYIETNFRELEFRVKGGCYSYSFSGGQYATFPIYKLSGQTLTYSLMIAKMTEMYVIDSADVLRRTSQSHSLLTAVYHHGVIQE